MGIQDYIAISLALAAVWFTGRTLWRTMAGDSGCSSCPSKNHTGPESPKLKKTPLVALNTESIPHRSESDTS